MNYGPSPLCEEVLKIMGRHDPMPTIVYFDPKLCITDREERLIRVFMEEYDLMEIRFLQYMYEPDLSPPANHDFNGFGHHMHFRKKSDYLLIHETAHAWQHAKGLLQSSTIGYIHHGKFFGYEEARRTPWAKRPWEIEADEVTNRFLHENDLSQV